MLYRSMLRYDCVSLFLCVDIFLFKYYSCEDIWARFGHQVLGVNKINKFCFSVQFCRKHFISVIYVKIKCFWQLLYYDERNR